MAIKYSELPKKEFNGESITNMFYVDKLNTHEMSIIELSDIFLWIKKQLDEAASKQGFVVELKEDKIIFTKK